ncbi:MAG: HEAT repeat domain-containing protein, partial [Polyangiaceae bacterium]
MVGLAMVAGCSKSSATPSAAPADAAVSAAASAELKAIARAEDQRRAGDIGERALTSHDVSVRRLAARALARIADDASESGLLRALSDEDPEVVAWGAYGLGFTCKGKEDAHVMAISARAASVDEAKIPSSQKIDLRASFARAVGKCGGPLGEAVLTSWVRAHDAWSVGASYGLGDIANKRGTLSDATVTALLDAAAPNANGPPLVNALYPFSRAPHVPEAFAQRVLETARDGLAQPSVLRIFAVRSLAR